MPLFDLDYQTFGGPAGTPGQPSLRVDTNGNSILFQNAARVVNVNTPLIYGNGFTIEYGIKPTAIGQRSVGGGISRIVSSVHAHSNDATAVFELGFDNWNAPGAGTILTPSFAILEGGNYQEIDDRPGSLVGEARGTKVLVVNDVYHLLGTIDAAGLCQLYVNGILEATVVPNINMTRWLGIPSTNFDITDGTRVLRDYFEVGTRFHDGAWRTTPSSGAGFIDEVRFYSQHFDAVEAGLAAQKIDFTTGPAEDASQYSQSDFQPNPESIGGGFRLDTWWKADGTRAWTARDSSNRCDQHDVSPPWSISAGAWTNRIDDTTNFTDVRAIQISPDGTRFLFLGGSSNPFIRSTVMTVPFDLSSFGAATSTFYNVGALDMYWSADGFTCWIYRSTINSIEEHAVSTAFDASTFNTTAAKTFDLAPDVGTTITTFTFSADGTFLYAIDNNRLLVSWTLTTPFDIDTAGSFVQGSSVGSAANMGIPRGLFFRPDNGDLHLTQDQNTQNMKVFTP